MKTRCITLLIFFLLLETSGYGINIDSLRNESKTNANDTLRCRALIKIASYYIESNFDSAIVYSEQLLTVSSQTGIHKYIISSHNFLGYIYREQGKYKEAMTQFLEALELGKKWQLKDREMFTRLDLGNLYTKQGLITKSMECLREGWRIAEELKDTIEMVNFYNNMSINFKDSSVVDSAYFFQNLALNLMRGNSKYSQDQNYFDLLSNMAWSCSIMKKNQEGLDYSLQVYQFGNQNKLPTYIYYGAINTANFYYNLKNIELCTFYLSEAEKYVYQLNDIHQRAIVLGRKIDLALDQGKVEQAKWLIANYINLKDSISKNKYLTDIADMETKYFTKEKEARIIEQNNVLFKQKAYIYGILLAFGIISLVSVLYYVRYKAKQKSILDQAIIKEQQLGIRAVIEAQEKERQRIARELHDGVAQELVAIKLGFESIQKELISQSPQHHNLIENLNQQLHSTSTEVRNISHDMLPPALENNKLADALQQLLRNSLENKKIATEFSCQNLPSNLDKDKAMGIYRIIQELINNIIKHSKATKVELQAYQINNQLILQLEDNGIGFDFQESLSKGSLGLLNILSRVKNLNAQFHSELGLNHGVVSTLRVPL